MLERFFKVEENVGFQNALPTHGVVKRYSAGVVTQGRRIGS
jgi:hypothetical protein